HKAWLGPWRAIDASLSMRAMDCPAEATKDSAYPDLIIVNPMADIFVEGSGQHVRSCAFHLIGQPGRYQRLPGIGLEAVVLLSAGSFDQLFGIQPPAFARPIADDRFGP